MNDLMTKSFLSYVDLKKQAEIDLQVDVERGDLELNPTDQENLSLFFKEVESVKLQIDEISNLLQDLKGLNEEAKLTHSAKILRGLRDRMDSDTVSILRKVKSVKSRLEALDSSNAGNRRMSEVFREGSIVDRSRVAVTNGLRMKFKDLICEFTGLREKIMADHKEDLRRKYFNATGELPDEEIVEKLLSGSAKIEVFEGRLRGACLEEDKERYEVVRDIQRSLNKLHQVFLDMAVLIDKQGEQLDDIEQNVVHAKEYISGGTNSLHYAKQMKRRNKNWVLLIFAVAVLISLVCIISVASSR